MQENNGITALLKKKYLAIMLLLVLFAVLAFFSLTGKFLYYSLGVSIFVGVCTFGLYNGFLWQLISKKLRPFVVARLLQVISTLGLVILVYTTWPMAKDKQLWPVSYTHLTLPTILRV